MLVVRYMERLIEIHESSTRAAHSLDASNDVADSAYRGHPRLWNAMKLFLKQRCLHAPRTEKGLYCGKHIHADCTADNGS